MKIGFLDTQEWEQKYLKEKLTGHELEFFDSPNTEAMASQEALSNFITTPITAEMLEKLPNLKYISTRSTGFDHIDLAACEKRSVLVSNVPTYGENTVAEFTFALLLALSRKIYPAIKRLREEANFSSVGLQGFDLKGKIIGVVGTGHIGAYVIKIAQGFGMKVVAYDPYPNSSLQKECGFEYLGLDELLKCSDVVTLHVPYMPATHHLINMQNIQLIKPGAVLINTARGGLIETQALVSALTNKILAGAAVDVLEEEGYIAEEAKFVKDAHPSEQQLKNLLADHELMHMENVIVTPHNAFNSKEALMRILDTTVENLSGFSNGKKLNLVKSK